MSLATEIQVHISKRALFKISWCVVNERISEMRLAHNLFETHVPWWLANRPNRASSELEIDISGACISTLPFLAGNI
jgi:hypothetical protein